MDSQFYSTRLQIRRTLNYIMFCLKKKIKVSFKLIKSLLMDLKDSQLTNDSNSERFKSFLIDSCEGSLVE